MAYRAIARDRRQLTWFDRSGNALGAFGPADENDLLSPEISPDGRRVAVSRIVQGKTDIWLQDASRPIRFTSSTGANQVPSWASDGSRIVFNGNASGPDLFEKLTSGAETEKLLVKSPQTKIPHDWSADGRFLLYHSVDAQTQRDLWILPQEGDRKLLVFLDTNFDERRGQFSPNGG